MNIVKSALVVTTCILLSGCATIFGESSDKITIHSQEPNAVLSVNGNKVGRGSAVYSLSRDKTAIITASKKGCADSSVPTERGVNSTTFLNIFFWPGFIVDAITGSIHEADPKDYAVTPNCGA